MTRADDTGPGHEISDVVDDLERKIERERDERDVPGSRSDREDVEPVDTGDDAPD